MLEKPVAPKKLSEKSTKQEMLEAYQAVVEQLEAKRAAELNPAKRLEEKKAEEALKVAESVAPDRIDRAVGDLKSEIGRMLADISEKLAAETAQYKSVQKAIETKQSELQELYGIEKAAASLAALIEGQNQKRREFELELASQKEQLKEEIEATRAEWEQEQKARETEVKERELTEKKARDREKEDYAYAIKREQQAIKDKLNDEKALLEKEIKLKREAAEKDLTEREKVIVEREKDLAQMRERVAAFPKELQEAVNKAVAEVTARLTGEAKTREELLRKECEGERNVFKTRVEGLEKTIKDLGERNARLTQQLDAAYQKVQEIAEKAIEGSSQSKSYAELQKLLSEQSRRPAPDKS
jgi:hypothetical protein